MLTAEDDTDSEDSGLTAMRRFAVIFLSLALPGLTACSTPAPHQILTAFHDDDFQTWTRGGTSTLSGQAFVKLPDGRVISCAGETVFLKPAVGYNTELEQLLQTGRGVPDNYDHHERKYDHITTCDGAGKFSFDHLEPLNWLVMTHVRWQETSSMSYFSGPSDKGGYLFSEIKIRDGENTILLSNTDFVEDKP